MKPTDDELRTILDNKGTEPSRKDIRLFQATAKDYWNGGNSAMFMRFLHGKMEWPE